MTVKEAKLKGYKIGEYADYADGFEVIGEDGFGCWKPKDYFLENYELDEDEELEEEVLIPFSDDFIRYILDAFKKGYGEDPDYMKAILGVYKGDILDDEDDEDDENENESEKHICITLSDNGNKLDVVDFISNLNPEVVPAILEKVAEYFKTGLSERNGKKEESKK